MYIKTSCTKIFAKESKNNYKYVKIRWFSQSNDLVVTTPSYWKKSQNQRVWFDQMAIKLDIKKPEEWRSVRVNKLLEMGGLFIQDIHNGSLLEGKENDTCELSLNSATVRIP
jgi:hypothetical protein